MSRRKQHKSGGDVEITLDRRFLFAFLGILVLVLALGLGLLVGQLSRGSLAAPAAQPAQLSQSAAQQTGQPGVVEVQSDQPVQVVPQSVPAGQGDTLTDEDATGLVAGDVLHSPCFVVNLLEFQKNVVKADFRITKKSQTGGPHPQLAIEGLNSHCNNAYDFGRLEPTEVGQETFRLKNVGDAPLNVTGLYTSCGCTVAQVEGHEVGANGALTPPLVLQPGETKEFMIALDAKRVENSTEPRIVQIFSDDPRGIPFGDAWPYPGQDRELRFAVLSLVGEYGTSSGE